MQRHAAAYEIGSAGDPLEREADRAADSVMSGRHVARIDGVVSAASRVQRSAIYSRVPVGSSGRIKTGKLIDWDYVVYADHVRIGNRVFDKTTKQVIGSWPWLTNNPGDITVDPKEAGKPRSNLNRAYEWGAVKDKAASTGHIPLAIFPDGATGAAALKKLYAEPEYRDKTLKAAIEVHLGNPETRVPGVDDPKKYLDRVKERARKLGVKEEILGKTLADIELAGAMDAIVEGFGAAEGYENVGVTYTCTGRDKTDDSKIPQTVRNLQLFKSLPDQTPDEVLRLLGCKVPSGDGGKAQKKAAEPEDAEEDETSAPTAQDASVARALGSSASALPGPVRRLMERRFGHDFSRVRIHIDSTAQAAAQSVAARAYTVGQDIVFAAGQYAPQTDAGQRLLAHELAHVVQQSRPGPVDSPSALEQEARAAGSEVEQWRSVSPARTAAPGSLHRDASDPAGSGGRADDRIEVIADRATGKLRVVRLDKRGKIVAGLAEITPPKGETLEAASVEAKLHETSRLTDTRGTYKIKLPPRYTATTNPKETVQVKSTTPQELARKEVNRKKVEEYLDAQDAELGTNFKFVYQADLANEEKVAELMRSEGYRKFEDAQNKKRYWTEVKRLMQLDRESIKEAYLARGEVLSDKQADDTWVDRKLEKPQDEKTDRPKPHMSALEQWEARHRAQAEKYLYEQEQRAQAVGFAEEQAEITAHRVAPGSKSSAAEQQEARSWAALAGRDLEGDDAVTRQINAQVREHRGDLVEFATKEAAWARMHHGENSPEARRWQQVLDGQASSMKAGGFDQPWRPNMRLEAQQDAEDLALMQSFRQMGQGLEGLSVKEMREILRRGRSRQELSSWERKQLDEHGVLPNEVSDARGVLQGYKLYAYEQLGLNGSVGQVTEEIVDPAGKRQSITKTVTLTPALETFEDLSRSLPYLSTAISAGEAVFGKSLRLRDVYSESGRDLSFGERMEAILNGLPSVGPLGKVAHVAGRIMLAKTALEVSTGLSLSGTGIDAILAGKPVWLKPNDRARLALQGAAMHIAYSGFGAIQGTTRNRAAIDQSLQVEPHQWRDPGKAPNASEGAPFQTAGQRTAKGVAGLGETLMAGGMKPGVPALVYHEGVPLIAEMHEGAPKQRPQATGSGHGAAPRKPAAGEAKAAVVQRGIEESQGRAPKAEHRQEPTPAQRAEAWTQIDEIQAAWQALGVPLPEVTAHMDLPTSFIHESRESPTQLRRINLGYNLAPTAHPEGVPLADRANAELSVRAAVSHEAVGHYEAFVADKVHPLHEETQASLRAAILAPGLTIQERGALIRDAVARLQHYEQGTPAPGREGLKSRWQRPTLVLPPGLWLEPLKGAAAPGPRRSPGAPPAAPVEVHGVERPSAGRPSQESLDPKQAGAPAAGIDREVSADVDKAFQGVESAAGGGGQLRAEPGVRVPVNKSGKPVDVMTVGGGRQAKENLGLPPDPNLIKTTQTDIDRTVQPDLVLDATKPVPRSQLGKHTALVINNPYGYVPDIRQLQAALAPGGKIIVQGHWKANKFFRELATAAVPEGMKRTIEREAAPLGSGFKYSDPARTGEPIPDARITFEFTAPESLRLRRGTVAPWRTSRTGDVHDLGPGTYFTFDQKVARQYAVERRADYLKDATPPGASKRPSSPPGIVLESVLPREGLKIFDFYNNPSLRADWEAYLRRFGEHGERILSGRGSAQHYNSFFQGWLKSKQLKPADFDVIIGPEYRNAGSQVCVSNPDLVDKLDATAQITELTTDAPSGAGRP